MPERLPRWGSGGGAPLSGLPPAASTHPTSWETRLVPPPRGRRAALRPACLWPRPTWRCHHSRQRSTACHYTPWHRGPSGRLAAWGKWRAGLGAPWAELSRTAPHSPGPSPVSPTALGRTCPHTLTQAAGNKGPGRVGARVGTGRGVTRPRAQSPLQAPAWCRGGACEAGPEKAVRGTLGLPTLRRDPGELRARDGQTGPAGGRCGPSLSVCGPLLAFRVRVRVRVRVRNTASVLGFRPLAEASGIVAL